MPPELRPQVADAAAVARAFSAAVVCVDGYEADDVIATLAARHRGEGVDVLTGDKDLLQLAAYDGVRILDPQGDPVDAAKKFGVPPGRIGDYLALVGDASDDVPGVPGVGPKGAAKLLAEHGDLDSILAAAESTMKKSKRRESLRENAELARTARTLVTLRDDVPLDAAAVAGAALPLPGSYGEEARAFLQRHELRQLESRLFPAAPRAPRSATAAAPADMEIPF